MSPHTCAWYPKIVQDARWAPYVSQTRIWRHCSAVVQTALRVGQWRDMRVRPSYFFIDDHAIMTLNHQYRQKHAPTDVLSFPAQTYRPGRYPAHCVPPELGEVYLAYETCMRQASTQGVPPLDHILHLMVHGTLHLLGYDHETDRQAVMMETLERRVLAQYGISDPY